MQAFGFEVNRNKVGVGVAHPLFQTMPVEHPKSELPIVLKKFVAISLGLVHHDAAKVDIWPRGNESHHCLITREFGAANLAPFQFASDAVPGLKCLPPCPQTGRTAVAWTWFS